MFFKHPLGALALVLFIQVFPAAQTPGTQEPATAEQQEARQALERKALALLDGVITDAQALKPLNRLRLQIAAADLLWPRDEKRARAIYEKSISDFNELVAGIDTSEPNFYVLIQGPMQLYNEIENALAQHDPQMALDFLRQTRLPQQPQESSKFANPDYQLQREAQLASQIAAKDPNLALQIGMESLEKGNFSNLTYLLQQLQGKDPDGAARLASALIKRLLSENLLLNNDASNTAISLLEMASNQAHYVPANGKPVASSPLIDEQSYRALMDLTLNAMLSSLKPSDSSDWRERNSAQNLLNGSQRIMSSIEKYAPDKAQALKRRFADLNRNVDAGSRFWRDNQELIAKGSVDDLLGLATKAPPEMHNQIYQQAAWKALNQGDETRARQIINDNITNPAARRQLLEQVDRQVATKEASEGKLEQARLALARLRTNEERATMLTQLAHTLASKGDQKTALQVLDEARSLVSNRAENFNQLQAQLLVARTYTSLDPSQSFRMLETLVEHSNELLSAAEVLNGFGVQYFNDGEMIGQGSILGNIIAQMGNDLGQLAHTDFDRARDVAGRFQRLEVRLMTQLSIIRQVLSNQQGRRIPVQIGGAYPFSVR